MIKMADLIKKQNDMIRKSTGMKITEKLKKEGGPGSGPHSDDEENPFDREPSDDELKDIEKQFEGNLNEVDFEKIKLPSQVNRFLNKFVQSMKDANLNRMKRAAILFKVIDAAGMTPQQLMADISRIKREL